MSLAKAIDMPPTENVLDKSVASYLGLAIGDALGATVEFMTEREIAAKYTLHREITGGGWLRLKPGQVTDDTQMALVIGETILSGRTICAFDIAQAFSDWMKSKPIDIGNTVRRGIVNFRYSDIPMVQENDADAGNGACMRTLPIALATFGRDRGHMVKSSRLQAHITHHNKLSDAGTECINTSIQMLLAGADRTDIENGPVASLMESHPLFEYRKRRITNPTGYIVETLQAVFQSFFSTDSFEDCLVDVVNRGGDADTTGAIAGMLAGALYGNAGIPDRWLKKLDSKIRLRCQSQAMELVEKSRVISISLITNKVR